MPPASTNRAAISRPRAQSIPPATTLTTINTVVGSSKATIGAYAVSGYTTIGRSNETRNNGALVLGRNLDARLNPVIAYDAALNMQTGVSRGKKERKKVPRSSPSVS